MVYFNRCFSPTRQTEQGWQTEPGNCQKGYGWGYGGAMQLHHMPLLVKKKSDMVSSRIHWKIYGKTIELPIIPGVLKVT